VRINAAAAAISASLVAGENVQLAETPEAQVRVSVPGLTTARADLEAVTGRVEALENEGNDIPGKLKIDDELTNRDSSFALHIGADRIFAGNAFLAVVNSNNVVVSQVLRGDLATSQDPVVQLHVTPSKTWVKDLQVTGSLVAPTINVPGRILANSFPLYDASYTLHATGDRVYAKMLDTPQVSTQFLLVAGQTQTFRADASSSRQAAFTTHVGASRMWTKALTADSLTSPEITTLNTWATDLDARTTATEAVNGTQQTEIDLLETEVVDLKLRASTLEGGVAMHYGFITTLQGRAATTEGEVDALQTRATALETANTSQTAQINDLKVRATTVEGASVFFNQELERVQSELDEAEVDIADLDLRTTALQNSVGAITTGQSTQDAAISQLSSGVSVLQTNVGGLTTRVATLEGAGSNVNIPGRLLVNNAAEYNPSYALHVGLSTMTAWLDANTVVAESLLVPGADNVRPLKVNSSTTRDSSYQMHVGPSHVWAKNMTVETSLTAPELTTVQTGLASLTTDFTTARTLLYDVETLTMTMWDWKPTVDSRLTNAEANRVTARNSTATTDSQFNVLAGTNVIPLVAGPGIRFEVVNRTIFGGMQIPDYIRVSAGPWVGGRLRSDGFKLSSVGRFDYTVSGSSGAAAGCLISWTEPHPANLDFVKLVTPLPMAQGRERLFWNTWIGSNRSFRVYIQDFNNVGVDRHFTFAVF
jgi:hypothetical protein